MAKTGLNPQQVDFLSRYMNPESPSYGNAYDSAVGAGYSKEYAKNITKQAPWLSEIRGKGLWTAQEILERLQIEAAGQHAKDRIRSLELLGKAMKLFVEQHGGKVEHEHVFKDVSDQELDGIIENLVSRRQKAAVASVAGKEQTQS